jgi:Uri superfamily endonuclease
MKGIIYAIVDNGYFYIGSTTKSLEERMYTHMSDCKKKLNKYSKLYSYINNIRGGWENIIYIILEEIECETITQLKKKEYDYIKKHVDDNLCLNKLSDIKSEFMLYKRKYK